MKSTVKANFIRYVSLNILSMVGLSCYILADTIFIANGIGAQALAALNLVLPIYSFISGVGLMLGIGAATRYSISSGEKDKETANRTFTYAVSIAGIIGLIMAGVGLIFGRQIAGILGANAEVLEDAKHYLTTILIFAPAFMIDNVIISFVRNDKQPRLAMFAMIIGSLSNVVLDFIFIFTLNMGMFGAALATGIAPVLSMAIMAKYVISSKSGFKFKRCHVKVREIIKIVEFGVPSFINEFSYGIVMMVFNYTVLALSGNIGVASYGIIANLAFIFTSVFTGIAQGIQPLISEAYGAGNKETIRQTSVMGLTLALIIGIAVCAAGLIFPAQIVELFNAEKNMEMQKIAVPGIMIYFTALIFISINIVQTSILTSVAKTKYSFYISIIRGFIAVLPLVLILPAFWGMTGVWLAVPCAEAIACGFAIYSMKKEKKPI